MQLKKIEDIELYYLEKYASILVGNQREIIKGLDTKKDILDEDSLIVTIEAGNVSSWKKYLGKKGISLGIDRFGKSAPYKKIYDHLNLSVEKILATIQNKLRE